jgi:stress-induced morphogen
VTPAPAEAQRVITPFELTALVRRALPDAHVEISDRTGTNDHYNLKVVSKGFAGMTPLERHRLVYKALGEALKDGRLHAVELTTLTPDVM